MLLLVLIIFCQFTYASQETILFIDTNDNHAELKTARTTALKLGKKFITYPSNGEEFDSKDALEKLRSTNFSSLIVSGHNGGSTIYGDKSNAYIDYSDISDAVNQNQYSKSNTRTLMLLGCNTANKGKILQWKNTFPNLEILGGYDGSAPLGDKPAGHSYIREVLTKADEIVLERDKSKLEELVRSLQHINYLEASLYINQVDCNDLDNSKEYLYRPLNRYTSKRFMEFNFRECEANIQKFEKEIYPRFLQYFTGEVKNETSESESELRSIYNFFHQKSHCLDEHTFNMVTSDSNGRSSQIVSAPDWETVLFLRFWKNVQSNISKYYKDDIKEHLDLLSSFQEPETISLLARKKLEELKKEQELVKKYVDNYDLLIDELDKKAKLHQESEEKLKYLETKLRSITDQFFKIEGIQDLIREFETTIFPSDDYTLSERVDYLIQNNENNLTLKSLKSIISNSNFEQLNNEREELYEIVDKYYEFPNMASSARSKREQNYNNLVSRLNGIDQEIFELSETLNSKNLKIVEKFKIPSYDDFKNFSRSEIGEFVNIIGKTKSQVQSLLPESISQKLNSFENFVRTSSYDMSKYSIPYSWYNTKTPRANDFQNDSYEHDFSEDLTPEEFELSLYENLIIYWD